MTAATALVASTLTAPPGRSTLATVVMAAAGESTYSRTLWHSTRSAPCSPMTAARSPTSPWTARSCTFISAARRCAAASESGLGSITVTVWPWPASGHRGSAGPAAGVHDVQPRPAGLGHEPGHDGPQHLPDDSRPRVVVPVPPLRRAYPGWRARPGRHPQPSATTFAGHGPSSLTVGPNLVRDHDNPRPSPRTQDRGWGRCDCPARTPACAEQNLRDPFKMLRVCYRASHATPAPLPRPRPRLVPGREASVPAARNSPG